MATWHVTTGPGSLGWIRLVGTDLTAQQRAVTTMNDPVTKLDGPPIGNSWLPGNQTKVLVLGIATSMGLYLCYLLARPFLPALTWALALAILVSPFHAWIESRLKRANMAASISILLVALIVAVPSTFLGQRILAESAKGAEIIRIKVQSGEWRQAVEAQPRLAVLAGWLEQKADLPGTVNTLTTWLTTTAGTVVKGSIVQLIGFLLVFYLLFYFLRDRKAALQALKWLSPLTSGEMDRLFLRVEDAVFATVYGTLAVSAVQGLLGGLMFWWLGLPAPLLWGIVMAALAIVPVLGAFIIWVPVLVSWLWRGAGGRPSSSQDGVPWSLEESTISCCPTLWGID